MDDDDITLLREEFHRKGFVKIPPSTYSLDACTVSKLRDEFETLFFGEYETGIYPDEIHWRPGISKENVTRELCNAWKSSTMIRNIVTSKKLGWLACQLMSNTSNTNNDNDNDNNNNKRISSWTCTRLGQDDVIHKPPMSNPVGFHQDGAYISDNFVPRDNNCLTMWIALDDADAENGALQYAPGSHLWTMTTTTTTGNNDGNSELSPIHKDVTGSSFHYVEEEKSQEQQEENTASTINTNTIIKKDYLTPLRQAAMLAGKDVNQVEESIETIHVPAGHLLVHHQNIWHGSGPNQSKTRLRRALVAHLLNGQVQWRTNPRPPHYIYGRYYIRGESIPREDFFPITYSATTTNNNNEIDKNNENDNDNYNGLKRTIWLDDK